MDKTRKYFFLIFFDTNDAKFLFVPLISATTTWNIPCCYCNNRPILTHYDCNTQAGKYRLPKAETVRIAFKTATSQAGKHPPPPLPDTSEHNRWPSNLCNLHSYLGSLLIDIFIEMQVDMRVMLQYSARMQWNGGVARSILATRRSPLFFLGKRRDKNPIAASCTRVQAIKPFILTTRSFC